MLEDWTLVAWTVAAVMLAHLVASAIRDRRARTWSPTITAESLDRFAMLIGPSRVKPPVELVAMKKRRAPRRTPTYRRNVRAFRKADRTRLVERLGQ